MSIKNILVAYSGEAAKKSALKHAVKLAKLHGAWVTGVISHQGQSIAEERFGARLPSNIIEEIRQIDRDRIENIKKVFFEILADAGLRDRAEFIDLEKNEVTNLSTFARMFDVTVMGVHSKDMHEAHLSAYPDRVALESGRPVLIVPNGYEADDLADHALVAWDGKRASARALGDAMNYLETKPKVTVLVVGKQSIAGVDYLLKSLERHGVEGNLLIKEPEYSIANTILTTANEISAKLIVMGAYEHSKFAQDIFGGVTRHVMNDA
jgi:nucleotide-binding universal stress UspA family protein